MHKLPNSCSSSHQQVQTARILAERQRAAKWPQRGIQSPSELCGAGPDYDAKGNALKATKVCLAVLLTAVDVMGGACRTLGHESCSSLRTGQGTGTQDQGPELFAGYSPCPSHQDPIPGEGSPLQVLVVPDGK